MIRRIFEAAHLVLTAVEHVVCGPEPVDPGVMLQADSSGEVWAITAHGVAQTGWEVSGDDCPF